MIAAEQWYEYQNNYQKYGLALKAEEGPKVRRSRSQTQQTLRVSARARKTAVGLLFLIGLVLIVLIVLTAYSADVTYRINQLEAQQETVRNDIANLTVAIKTATGIETIERRAVEELGMVYAPLNEVIYVGGEEIHNFGVALKSAAYQ